MPTTTLKKDKEERLPAAHSLREAADTDNTLEGYAAMNAVDPNSDIAHAAEEYPVDLHQQISRLAYQLWEERRGEGGSADEDWFQAEKRVKALHL
jgi:hypothetical protein